MQKAQDTTQDQPKDKPAEKHTGSKIAFALAFSTVGAKISTIGTAIDAADLLRDKPAFKEKMKTLFSSEILVKLRERTIDFISDEYKKGGQLIKEPPVGELIRASMKPVKWTLITGVVGMVAGAAIGWVRGEKAGSAKNIIKHPIKATKAVFGLSEPLDDNGEPIVRQGSPAVAKETHTPDAVAEGKASPAWQARMEQNAAKQAETSRSL